MPNYDFKCSRCEHQFTENVSIKDRDKIKCPKCQSNVKQIFTTAGFVVKGGSKCGSCSSGGGG